MQKKNFWLAILYQKIGPKMTFDFEDPGKEFLKNFNLLHLSHALLTIFIIKVCFPANTDNSGYGNDLKRLILGG